MKCQSIGHKIILLLIGHFFAILLVKDRVVLKVVMLDKVDKVVIQEIQGSF